MHQRYLILAALLLFSSSARAQDTPNIHLRGSLNNSRIQFAKSDLGHVAFMGGSITEMNGYRPMVEQLLRERFPETEFTFTDAGISSTCSTTGAFRLEQDVLSKGPVDLFFVEFAVNDDQDAVHARRDCIRGMEGIVRQVRKHNKRADIVIIHFVNPPMLEMLAAGKMPISIGSHEEVAKHYDIPTVNLAHEVADRIDARTLTWKVYGGTHPAEPGNRLCAELIDQLLSQAWQHPLADNAHGTPHEMPVHPLDEHSYSGGRFVEPSEAQFGGQWEWRVPNWKEIPGQLRPRFQDVKLLVGDQPGAELRLTFRGTAIGAYLLAGPDAGTVEVSVDNGPFHSFDLYHRYSRGLHYPRTVMFDADLAPDDHSLRMRIAGNANQHSEGKAVRILEFATNDDSTRK